MGDVEKGTGSACARAGGCTGNLHTFNFAVYLKLIKNITKYSNTTPTPNENRSRKNKVKQQK